MTDEELIARLRKADEYEPLGHDGWEAADLITALLTANAALRADVGWWKRDSAAAWDKCEERRIAQEAAEAKVEKLRGALESITRDVDLMATGRTSLLGKMGRTARAALATEKPVTEDERKVAQMREDFPNGI